MHERRGVYRRDPANVQIGRGKGLRSEKHGQKVENADRVLRFGSPRSPRGRGFSTAAGTTTYITVSALPRGTQLLQSSAHFWVVLKFL